MSDEIKQLSGYDLIYNKLKQNTNQEVKQEEVNSIIEELKNDDGTINTNSLRDVLSAKYGIEDDNDSFLFAIDKVANSNNDNTLTIEDLQKSFDTSFDSISVANFDIDQKTVDNIKSDIENEINNRKILLNNEKSSRGIITGPWNWIKGVFGGGDKKEEKEIEQLQAQLDSINETGEAAKLDELYKETFGKTLKADKLENIQQANSFVGSLSDENKREIIDYLEYQLGVIEDIQDEAEKQNGWCSGLWHGIKNLSGIGASSKKIDVEIDSNKKLIKEAKKDPDKLANLYKSVVGRDLTSKEFSKLQEGTSSLSIYNKVCEYQAGQQMGVDTIADIATGIGSLALAAAGVALTPVSGGASLALTCVFAGGINCLAKPAFKATDCLGNERTYDWDNDFKYDVTTGFINGAMAPLANGAGTLAGSAGKSIMKAVGIEALEETVKGTGKQALKAKILTTVATKVPVMTQRAVEGSLAGAADAGGRALAQGRYTEIVSDSIKGAEAGFIASPIIGLGMDIAMKPLNKKAVVQADEIARNSDEFLDDFTNSLTNDFERALSEGGLADEFSNNPKPNVADDIARNADDLAEGIAKNADDAADNFIDNYSNNYDDLMPDNIKDAAIEYDYANSDGFGGVDNFSDDPVKIDAAENNPDLLDEMASLVDEVSQKSEQISSSNLSDGSDWTEGGLQPEAVNQDLPIEVHSNVYTDGIPDDLDDIINRITNDTPPVETSPVAPKPAPIAGEVSQKLEINADTVSTLEKNKGYLIDNPDAFIEIEGAGRLPVKDITQDLLDDLQEQGVSIEVRSTDEGFVIKNSADTKVRVLSSENDQLLANLHDTDFLYNQLEDNYQKLRKIGAYKDPEYQTTTFADKNSIKKAVSNSNSDVFLEEFNDIWCDRSKTGANVNYEGQRASLNVKADSNLIKELDELMTKGTYTNSKGKKVKIDNTEFHYKTYNSNNIEKWANREDPLTLYFNGNVNTETKKALVDITKKYQRGALSGRETKTNFWISIESQPTVAQSSALVDKAYNVSDELGQAVEKSMKDQTMLSSGQYKAYKEVIDNYNKVSLLEMKTDDIVEVPIQSEAAYNPVLKEENIGSLYRENTSFKQSSTYADTNPSDNASSVYSQDIDTAPIEAAQAQVNNPVGLRQDNVISPMPQKLIKNSADLNQILESNTQYSIDNVFGMQVEVEGIGIKHISQLAGDETLADMGIIINKIDMNNYEIINNGNTRIRLLGKNSN